MSLSAYLAKNYLTADAPPPKKKKKRSHPTPAADSSGLIIADDDALGWDSSSKNPDDADNDSPLTISSRSAEFRHSKKNAWKTVGAAAPSSSEQAEADAIIAAAGLESAQRAAEDDDATFVDDNGDAPRMESGAAAGLQSAASVTAALAKRQKEERRRFEADALAQKGRGQETIYRDASGRIVNVAMKRAEARAAAEAEERAKREKEKAMQAPAQLAAAQARKEELKEAKLMPFARTRDDEEMNRELKAKQRWDDPAAGFIKERKAGKSVSGKPLYSGPGGDPNRYGIRPGYRWDGVDRGNGFEKKWFAARERARGRRELEVQWEMDE